MIPTERQRLVVLRERAALLASEPALRGMAQELAADRRAGARALALRCLRRADTLAREERRLAGLLALRERLQRAGARRVAGVDEVGVGPLAGPVVAAAVILPAHPQLPGLDDSKRVPRLRREHLAAAIRSQAVAVGIGAASTREIDQLNIYHAALLAMRRAVEQLAERPDHLLVDARRIPGVSMPQTPLVGGDGRDASIAAASIVAKVTRDALMTDLDASYPGYGFARHKGYGTQAHLEALQTLGPTPHHRRSFAPVRRAGTLVAKLRC